MLNFLNHKGFNTDIPCQVLFQLRRRRDDLIGTSLSLQKDSSSTGSEVLSRVGVKYFSKYLSQVQVLFYICKYKYKFKYSEYLEDIKYIFNQVRVKYKYFGNKQ